MNVFSVRSCFSRWAVNMCLDVQYSTPYFKVDVYTGLMHFKINLKVR